MNLISDELESLMTWKSTTGLYIINECILQIRAELMMFGAPIKEVRLMKRKDNGENLMLSSLIQSLGFHGHFVSRLCFA